MLLRNSRRFLMRNIKRSKLKIFKKFQHQYKCIIVVLYGIHKEGLYKYSPFFVYARHGRSLWASRLCLVNGEHPSPLSTRALELRGNTVCYISILLRCNVTVEIAYCVVSGITGIFFSIAVEEEFPVGFDSYALDLKKGRVGTGCNAE